MYPLLNNGIVKIFGFFALSFFVALGFTPILTYFLYKFKAWRKDKEETRKVPRMGGLLIWVTVLILSLLFGLKVWLPLGVLVVGSLIGLLDDILSIRPWQRKNLRIRGLRFTWRMLVVLVIGLVSGWLLYQFYGQPFYFVALVPLVMLIIFGGSPLDGLDGLFAGSVIPMFAAYTVISYAQGQMDLAIFSALIAGSMLAFLYFNIPPARFFMGETGVIGLVTVLPLLAFLTRTVLLLPIIAMPLLITAISILLQIFSFQIFGKRIFYKSPLHHHFEAMGWPHYKITMRYWIFSFVFAIIGMTIALIV